MLQSLLITFRSDYTIFSKLNQKILYKTPHDTVPFPNLFHSFVAFLSNNSAAGATRAIRFCVAQSTSAALCCNPFTDDMKGSFVGTLSVTPLTVKLEIFSSNDIRKSSLVVLFSTGSI